MKSAPHARRAVAAAVALAISTFLSSCSPGDTDNNDGVAPTDAQPTTSITTGGDGNDPPSGGAYMADGDAGTLNNPAEIGQEFILIREFEDDDSGDGVVVSATPLGVYLVEPLYEGDNGTCYVFYLTHRVDSAPSGTTLGAHSHYRPYVGYVADGVEYEPDDLFWEVWVEGEVGVCPMDPFVSDETKWVWEDKWRLQDLDAAVIGVDYYGIESTYIPEGVTLDQLSFGAYYGPGRVYYNVTLLDAPLP